MPSFKITNATSPATDIEVRDPQSPNSKLAVVPAGQTVTVVCTIDQQADILAELNDMVTRNAGVSFVLAGSEEQIADAQGLGSELVIVKAFIAGTPGSAGDIVLYDGSTTKLPYAVRITDTVLITSTAISGKTGTLRSAAAGAGSALSDALTMAATGVARDATKTASATVAAGAGLWLRLSDIGCAGEVHVHVQRI